MYLQIEKHEKTKKEWRKKKKEPEINHSKDSSKTKTMENNATN